MVKAYNLTSIGNTSDIVGFYQNVDGALMFGALGMLMLFTITIILFLGFLRATNDDAKKSFAGAMFIGWTLSLLLLGMGILNEIVMYAYFVLMAISAATMLSRD